jgi:hypothetical protein
MIDPSLPLQAAVFSALSTALGTGVGVWDRVPVDATGKVKASFPFVQIGEDQMVSAADQCHDAVDAYVTVHVWSRAVGKVEAKTIMADVVLALDTDLVVSNHLVIAHLVENGPRHMTDADGLTSHSVVTLLYRMGPISS